MEITPVPGANTPATSLFVLLATAALSGAGFAAPPEIPRQHQRLALPGAPVGWLATDLDGDPRRDLLVLTAGARWSQEAVSDRLRLDDVAGLVEVMTVVPVLLEQRQLHAYRGLPGGGFEPVAPPLDLPPGVLSLEAAPPVAAAIAITDRGLSLVELADGRLALREVRQSPPAIAGSGALLPPLGVIADLDGNHLPDVLFPAAEGFEVLLGTPAGLATEPASAFPAPGDAWSSSGPIVRRYPLPEATDLDGDALPELLFPDPLDGWSRVRVLLNRGQGRFSPPREVTPPDPSEDGVWLGDGGDGGLLVTQRRAPRGTSLRATLADAREPRSTLVFRPLGAALRLDGSSRELDIVGFASGRDGELPLPGGFLDLDGDGRLDVATLTTDLGVGKALAALTLKRLTVDLQVRIWCGRPGGAPREVPDDRLVARLRLDLRDVELRQLAFFAGDFDGDGRRDFLKLDQSERAVVRLGRPDCRYPATGERFIALAEPVSDPLLVHVDDFDGDARSDLAVVIPGPIPDPGVAPTVIVDLYLSRGAAP